MTRRTAVGLGAVLGVLAPLAIGTFIVVPFLQDDPPKRSAEDIMEVFVREQDKAFVREKRYLPLDVLVSRNGSLADDVAVATIDMRSSDFRTRVLIKVSRDDERQVTLLERGRAEAGASIVGD